MQKGISLTYCPTNRQPAPIQRVDGGGLSVGGASSLLLLALTPALDDGIEDRDT